jgi:hypothetical protein
MTDTKESELCHAARPIRNPCRMNRNIWNIIPQKLLKYTVEDMEGLAVQVCQCGV